MIIPGLRTNGVLIPMKASSSNQLLARWTKDALDEAIAALQRSHGLDVSIYDACFLAKSLEKRRVAAEYDTVPTYLERLTQNPAEAEAVIRSLNINYSVFFRNPLTFALLEQMILPALADAKEMHGRTSIRIWSAGCAAGQEAWSIAMLLEELSVVRERPIPYSIIATDISNDALAQARRGIYSLAEVLNTPLKHIRTYFSVRDDACEIVPALRKHVDFSHYDLLDERSSSPAASIFGDFDLVICSNLLFYYDPEIRQRILGKVSHALSSGGYFVTGEAERDIVAKQETLRALMPLAAVFQKR